MRPNRDEIGMKLVDIIAERSTCKRAQVGCVITIESRIVTTGYAGAPSGLPHCDDEGIGCSEGSDGGCTRTSHAESGAIAFAARKGIALDGATAYLTLSPCLTCCKLLINAGIKRVVYKVQYRDPSGLDLLRQAGIEVITKWKI